MDTFCQFWNRINGEPYTDGVPPPVQYELQTMDLNVGGAELQSLSQEDMGQAAAEDVVKHYMKMHKGKNPARLGKPMSDEELKKFFGQTW